MKRNKIQKYVSVIAVLVIVALAATAVEYEAGRKGLELRTLAQEIKGVYLWLVMPFGILWAGNALLRHGIRLWAENTSPDREKLSRALHWIRRILVALLVLAILGLSFFRGMYYFFTDEMVEEKRLEDGYLQGKWSAIFSETQTGYYEVVAGMFRRPFPGRTRGELTEKVQEKYGPEAEYVRQQPGGWHVFRLEDPVALGEFIYFHVSDSYEMEDNGDYQILLSEAGHFWENRNRRITLGRREEVPFEQVRDTGAEIGDPGQEDFYITCYGTAEDISVCAADLTDWLQFVKNTGQYPWGADSDAAGLLASVWVGSGEDYFAFSMKPVEDFMTDSPWEERYRRMEEKLSGAFAKHQADLDAFAERMKEQREAASSEGNPSEEDSAEGGRSFMDTWDGDYEKECQVGDGQIRYRMVVEDAALGSRFYGLLKSTDGGESWQMWSRDPFDQQMGQGIDFTFLSEEFGFATLMHNGGDEAYLYVTEDGGKSYRPVVMEGYTASLENGFTYNPYDYPQMPWEENGIIYVLCGQGADGDYNGGDAAGLALYRSTDGGHIFSFVEIRKPEE